MKVSFLLLFSSLHYIVRAEQEKEILIQEIMRFCNDNGHKFLTFLYDQKYPEYVKQLIYKSATSNDLRIRSMIWETLKVDLIGNMDTVIILKEKDDDLKDTLSITNFHKRQKTILAIPEARVNEFLKIEKNFGKNSYFYLMTYDEKASNFQWYTFITLLQSKDAIMNLIHFNENGAAIENFDMKGIKIVATSDDWDPYATHSECNKIGRDCKNSGLTIDLMTIWAEKYNFTWDIKAGYQGDWGLTPVSGPYNQSGEWAGVAGDVANEKYAMSLNAWYWLSVRDPVWDFVPYGTDTTTLLTISKPPDIDPELFIRPFRNDAWLGIGCIIFLGLILTSIPYFLPRKYKCTRASKMCIFCLWCFFVPVSAYYKGAMKMFLNSDLSLPFDNLDQVLSKFPEWNLILVKGYEGYIKNLAMQGNVDYARYVSHMEKNEDLHVAIDVEQGIKKLRVSKTILFVGQSGLLKGALKQNPNLGEDIESFGDKKATYLCMMFNKNSPLVPMFSKASIETFEGGQYDHISTKWMGQDITYLEKLYADVLGPGQVFMVFMFLIVMLTSSFACLIFECMYFYLLKKKLLSRIEHQTTPTIQPRPSQEMASVDSND